MATDTTPGGNVFFTTAAELANTDKDKERAFNRDARDAEVQATAASAVSTATSAQSNASNAVHMATSARHAAQQVQDAQSTAFAQAAQAKTESTRAVATATSAKDESANTRVRVENLETMGGVAPGSVNDANMALHANQQGSQFRSALNAATADIAVQSRNYPSLQAAVDATPDGGRLVVAPGMYTLPAALTGADKTITIILSGATLRAGGAHGILNWSATVGTVYPVTGIVDSTSTSGGEPLDTTTITVTGLTGYQAGDLVKIISNDVIEGARPGSSGSESRRGEFAVVHTASSGSVTIKGRLRETYTTSPRILRINRHAVHIAGGAMEGAAGSTAALVGLTGLVGPTITGTAMRSGGPAVVTTGCYTGRMDYTVEHATNDPSASAFGYGLMDNASALLEVNVKARDVRHAYSDDTPRIPAGSTQAHQYGRSYGHRVTGMGHGTSGTAFDTHHAAEGIQFVDCQAVNCATGFALRGRRHRVVNGVVDGARRALYIFDEAVGNVESWGHVVDGLTWDRVTNVPIDVALRGVGHAQANTRETRKSYLRNLRGSWGGGSFPLMFAQLATLEVEDLVLTGPAGNAGTGTRVMGVNRSVVRAFGVTMDLMDATGGTVTLFNAQSTGVADAATVAVTGARVAMSATVGVTLAAGQSGPVNVFDLTGLTLNRAPGTLITGTHDAATTIAEYVVTSTGERSELIDTTAPATNVAEALRRTRRDATVVARPAAAATLQRLHPGRLLGQTVDIVNRSGVALTVEHILNVSLVDGLPKTLGQRDRLRLVWEGTQWVQHKLI